MSMTVDFATPSEGELVSIAAHELSQPLQTLELACAAIQRRASADAEIIKLAQLATLSLQRLREMLTKLLDISHIECGRLSVDEQAVSIAEICEDLERRFSSVAAKKGLAFHCRHKGRRRIKTDPVLLCGMLSNLVSNAIRYTVAGEVRVESTLTADGGVAIAVRDTGIGIAEHQLREIFRESYRSKDARDIEPEGRGLGLGIVQRWSKLLGFRVTVRSELGAGSTFLVRVPPDKVVSPNRRTVKAGITSHHRAQTLRPA